MKYLKLILLLSIFIFTGMNMFGRAYKTIHVYVALCDNENQGIVKVPAKLGNGKDQHHNLYWGAAYGIKTYFKKAANWQLLKTVKNPKTNVLERIVFKNRLAKTYLVADAYDGAKIKQTIVDFLKASAGKNVEAVAIDNWKIPFGGASNLIVYIGHNGLMDFSNLIAYIGLMDFSINPGKSSKQKNSNPRDIIILCCYSKVYFKSLLKKTGANPLLWTSGLMAPEAYTLEGALKGWTAGETNEQIRLRAARAYNRFQKCGLKAAKRLLLTGW